MHFSLIYVADKPGEWAERTCEQYIKRMPTQYGFTQTRVTPVRRNKNTVISAARNEEWKRVSEKIARNALIVLLDECGKQFTSPGFSEKMDHWMRNGQDVAFVIAGADGVNEEVRANVDFVLALSQFTLPHELARVFFIEQLYRAWTILAKHPYHRV